MLQIQCLIRATLNLTRSFTVSYKCHTYPSVQTQNCIWLWCHQIRISRRETLFPRDSWNILVVTVTTFCLQYQAPPYWKCIVLQQRHVVNKVLCTIVHGVEMHGRNNLRIRTVIYFCIFTQHLFILSVNNNNNTKFIQRHNAVRRLQRRWRNRQVEQLTESGRKRMSFKSGFESRESVAV